MGKNRNLASRSVRALLVLGGCLLSLSAFAQGVSVLFGNVIDAATKAPVADAVVTVTSPGMQGEQIAVTDATGTYRVSQLPPGTYTIRVEKEAYKPYTRGDIDLRADHTIRLNIEILPEALRGEEVVVVGRAPTIDVGSSTQSTNITSDYVRNLAVSRPSGRGGAARSFESLALIAPTAQADTYGISINGTTSPENGYLLDGMSVQNPGFGLLGSPVTSEFIEEVNVITGGYLPEYGRSIGGIISAVTKSGSNEFHGSVFGTYSPGGMTGTPTPVTRLGNATSVIPSLYNIGDFGATLGGPIMQDRIWFFAGFQPSFTRYQLQKNFNRLATTADGTSYVDANGNPVTQQGFAAPIAIPGASQNFFADKKQYQYIAKLTLLANPDNRFSLSVTGTPSTSGGGNSFQIGNNTGAPPATLNGLFTALASKNTQTSTDVIGKWSSSFFEKRVLLDASVGWHRENVSALPADGTAVGSSQGLAGVSQIRYRRTARGARQNHSILDFEDNPDLNTSNPALAAACAPVAGGRNPCPVTTYFIGGPGFIDESTQDIWQTKIIGTYLLPAAGHHVLKAGFDARLLKFDHHKSVTGTVTYRESPTGTAFRDYRQYGYLQGPDDPVLLQDYNLNSRTSIVGGFLQDSWSILDVVTLNVGLRFDVQTAQGPDRKTGFTLGNQWSPRVGLVYDFTRQGRSKIFANFARYYEDIPLDALDREFPGERQIATVDRNCNPASLPGNPFRDCRPGGDLTATIRPSNNGSPNRRWSIVGGDTTIDPAMKAQSSDEIVAGAEYEVFPSARLGGSYTRRYFVRVIEDMSLDEANTYFLGNPGYGIASGFPKAVRNYNAFTFYLNKVFADLWLGQVSYTYSTLKGNYAGLFRPETGQLDPNINSDFDLISLLPNRSGPLPGDYQHQVKAFVAKELLITGPASISLGLGYTGRSGGPISALGSHPLYGNGEAFIIPRGAAGRLPWVHSVDPHLGFSYRVARDSVMTVSLDVFNLFNSQAATLVDENWTFSDALPVGGGTTQDLDLCAAGSPGCRILNASAPTTTLGPADKNPNFKNPTAYQSPRIFRFGARFTF